MLRAVSTVGKWVARAKSKHVARHFERQVIDCRRTQQETLGRLLALNAGTRFQQDHGLAPGLIADELRRRIPLTTYDDVAPYVEALRQGDTRALCGPGNPPLMFAITSGTSGASKSIPVTRPFLDDYRRGWTIWGYHTFVAHEQLPDQRILQVVSDYDRQRSPSGLPCGSISGLVQTMQNRFIRSKFVVPAAAMRIADSASKQYLTLRLALADRNVGLITTANPSTLIQLAQRADAERESLIRDIHDGTLAPQCALPDDVRNALRRRLARQHPGRARELSRIAGQADGFRPRDYWPDATLVAVWTGGSAGAYLPSLREWYGDVPIRDHGLQASEGRMTIPIENETPSGVLDVAAHFFEFIPEQEIDNAPPPTLLAHELEQGASYFIVLTTASGLYRYNISDVVRCTGHVGTTPLLEFLHKGAHISNIAGEKLTESQVVTAVRAACESLGCRLGHYTLTPVWGDPPGYRLLVDESDLPQADVRQRLAAAIEERLQHGNCEYHEKRRTGRLSPLTLELLAAGTWDRYFTRQQSRPGSTVEQYKHPCLKPDVTFRDTVLSLSDGTSLSARLSTAANNPA